MDTLYDKATKATHPPTGAIFTFNLSPLQAPLNVSTHISQILLYIVENCTALILTKCYKLPRLKKPSWGTLR